MSKKILIKKGINTMTYGHTKCIIFRSFKIIFIVYISSSLLTTLKKNTDYALKVHLYSLINVKDLRHLSCTVDMINIDR